MTAQVSRPGIGPALIHRTDSPPIPITGSLAVWLVLRLAQLCVGGYELGVNEGPFVRLLDRVSGIEPGSPWCAAFVAFCGAILGSTYPLGPSGYCPDLAAEAERKGVLGHDPEAGDIVLFQFAVPGEKAPRFAHTGFVLGVNADGSMETIEGNTNGDGGREGWQVCRRTRRLKDGDAVIHWHRLIAC